MDVFTIQDLKTLMERRGVCVSLYMPTHRAWKDVLKDPITFRNLLRETELSLTESGMRDMEIQEFLAPVKRLREDNDLFWRHSSDGLAAFISHDFFRVYRLPLPFEAFSALTDRFQIKPLLRLFADNGLFYILKMSQKSVRFYQATRFGIGEIEVTTMPESIDAILQYEDKQKQELRFEMQPTTGGGFRPGYGSYQPHEESLNDIIYLQLYARAVDKGIHPVLRGQNNPLIMAGVDNLHPIYRDANTYPYFVKEGIIGNPDLMNTRDLHSRAWKIVEPIFQTRRKNALERYMNSKGMGITSHLLERVVPASAEGRIDTLFVDEAAHSWGTFDQESRTIALHGEKQAGDGDLLDLATVNTLQNGGAVFTIRREEMPENSPVAAIYRY